MCFKKGDLVARKKYGSDVYFRIQNIIPRRRKSPVYVLKGVIQRLYADSTGEDLIKLDQRTVDDNRKNYFCRIKRHSDIQQPRRFRFRMKAKPGFILHLDGDEEYMERCFEHYDEADIKYKGFAITEREQPYALRDLLNEYKPDILVVTGHDSYKKGKDINSMDSYRNSRYFARCVETARSYEAESSRLAVFAGACQSYYEALMGAGANFASSPGRIIINALDPAMVSERVAVTDSRRIVTPEQVARVTESGREGVSGKNTPGQLTWS